MKYIIRSLFFITIIFAQWSTNPTSPQSLGSGVQVQLAATSDGGVYVAWLSDGNNYHVFLQRLNSMGEPQWSDNGMLISNNANASWIAVYHLNLAVDSEDNAIITTMDQRAGGAWEVYAYKISSDGTMLWGNDGVSLTSSSVSNMSPRLTVLPDNSVVVTWTHNDDTVLFQCISSDGTLLWDTGILIEDDDATLISPQPIVTSDGNVLIQWIRQTGPFWASNSQLYLQKYDYDGTAEWSNPIVAAGPVVFPMGNWLQQSVADDISGSFSAWTEISGSVQNARVQHIDEEGVLSWTGGVDLSTNSSNFRMSPQLTISENTQELMAIWKESNGSQTQRGVSAQRLDSNGDRLWGPNGASVVDLNSNYDYLDLNIAGFGDDLIATYIEQSGNMNGNIYAVRLDVNGDNVWTGGTVAVTNSNTSKSDMMITSGPGCVFIAWTESGSIYAHCLLEDGTLGVPIPPLLVPSEYPTIQAAIDSADDGDMIIVADGTYIENIDINKDISITSLNGADSTIIDGNDVQEVVQFGSSTTRDCLLEGFTITNGGNENGNSDEGGGGILVYGGSPTLKNLIITGNRRELWSGGGIHVNENGNPLVEGCIIKENYASGDGGGIDAWRASFELKNSTISNNASTFGQAIHISTNDAVNFKPIIKINTVEINNYSDANLSHLLIFRSCSLRVDNLTLQDISVNGNSIELQNSKGILSGLTVERDTSQNAIVKIYEGSEIDFNNLKISQGKSNDAPGIRIDDNSVVTIDTLLIEDSHWVGGSNAVSIWVNESNFTLDNGKFSNIYAEGEGSALRGDDGSRIEISNTFIDSSYSEGHGGGMLFYQSDYISIKNSSFIANRSVNGGGGIHVNEVDSLFIDNCSFLSDSSDASGTLDLGAGKFYSLKGLIMENNYAADGAGAINLWDNEKVEIIDSKFISNKSVTDGGAIYSWNTDSLFIKNSTFDGNESTDGNGGAMTFKGDENSTLYCEIRNTTFENNSGGWGGAIAAFEPIDMNIDSVFAAGNEASGNGGFIELCCGASVSITNSTIYNNETNNNDLNVGGSNLSIKNSIIWKDIIGGNASGTIEVTYSDVEGGFTGIGNINSNPLFCNPDSSDYNLAENSPCIGTGENGANMGAFGVGCGPIHVGPIWHVSITGSDSTGDGSEDNPFATIQTALNNANVSYYENIGNLSDTIMVHDGTYIINALGDEVLSHDIYSNGSYTAIIISENGPATTILEGSNEYSHIGMTEVGYTLHGFTLDGFQYFGSGDNIEFNNCLLIRTISFSATSCPEPCFTFNNSTFTENNVDQIDETSLFLNSIIYNNTNLSLNDTDTIRYCIHDLDFDGVGSINTDPLFCNPDSGDFTLAENSPAVGAGENGANIGAFGVGCGIQVDWNFSLSEPVIEVMGTDNVWNPGDTISVEMDYCNNTDVAHNWYPGVTIESDSSLTSLHSGHIWFYAMVVDECHTISWAAIANTSIISDTVVTFSAYPEALNCQSQPEYCIDGDTLTFEVPIVVQVVSAEPEPFAPEQFSLHQNYPNPFNPTTSLRYDLPEDNLVNITIYDMMGRQVKTLVNQTQDAGYKSVIWDATNDYGKPVSAGIYLYQIQVGKHIQTKKMVLLK